MNDNMLESRSIEPNDLIRTFKLDRCCNLMEEKYNNPKVTQKEICNQLSFTDRTIRRDRDDIKKDSPYRVNNHKKTPKQKPSTVTEDESQNENIKPVTSKRSKNNVMKGGNISDIHTISGKELLEQTLQNDKANSFL